MCAHSNNIGWKVIPTKTERFVLYEKEIFRNEREFKNIFQKNYSTSDIVQLFSFDSVPISLVIFGNFDVKSIFKLFHQL